ncbi:TPA: TerD family protein, partial [Klebsiella pneumoniae]|nr:TerD family protein [Klebsiella pneumoniae]
DPKYEKIVFIVQIYNGEKLQQHFGKVQNAFIRAVDGKNVEMARFDLSGGVAFNGQRSMVFAELVRESSGWKLNAIGEPSTSDSFVSHLRNYI